MCVVGGMTLFQEEVGLSSVTDQEGDLDEESMEISSRNHKKLELKKT